MTGPVRRAVGAVLAACALALVAAPMHAADGDPALELWLDRPLPEDVAEGIEVPIGLMVWDVQGQQLISGNRPFVRLTPATGDAEPTMVALVEDWNGHYGGSLPVPRGGMGTFEIGFGGTACDETRCQRQETLPTAVSILLQPNVGVAFAGVVALAVVTLFIAMRRA